MNSRDGVHTVHYCYELFGIRFLVPRPVAYLVPAQVTSETYTMSIETHTSIVLPSIGIDFDERADGTQISYPDFGRIIVSGMYVHIDTKCELSDIDFYLALAEIIVPLLCALRGALLIHAGAVAWNGKGVCYLGASGSGKSTSVALAVKEGAAVLSQDITVLTYDDTQQQIFIEAGGGFTELRDPSVPLLHSSCGDPIPYKGKSLFLMPVGQRIALSELYLLASPEHLQGMHASYKIFDVLLGSMLTQQFTSQRFPGILLKVTEVLSQKVTVLETPPFARAPEVHRGIV